MQTLRLRSKDLSSHIAVYGDTGGGKGLFIYQYLLEAERRGDMAIIWDPDREYARKFYRPERGDWLLDPGVADVPFWPIGDEVRDEAEAIALATCQFPDIAGVRDPFWTEAARRFFAWLLVTFHPTTAELGYLMANDHLFDKMVKGTEFETILTNTAPGLRSSVISHLNLAAQPLRMMPATADGRRTFTVRDYCAKRNSWVFLTSRPSYSAALKPLHTMWMGSFITRLIDAGKRKDLPTVHLVIEEASSLILQEFHTALVRLRKTENPVVFAIQNFSDLKAAYGDRALTIYSQPKTKVFYRISDNESAKKAEETIGQKTFRVIRETYNTGKGGRHVSFAVQKEREAVIPQSRIMNLEDRDGFLVQPGVVVPFRIPIVNIPDRTPPIQERVIPQVGIRSLAIPTEPKPEAEPKNKTVGVRPRRPEQTTQIPIEGLTPVA